MGKKYDHILKSLSDSEAEDMLFKLMERRPLDDITAERETRTKVVPIGNFIEEAKQLYANRGRVQGLSTGIKKIDEMTQGMLGGELILIGGQSHHGKTQLATNIAYNVARQGKLVTFVTLEMTKPQITERFMQVAGTDEIGDLPIEFQEAMNLDYRDISFLVGKAKRRGSQLVLIDHLHYFVRDAENQSNEIGTIVKNFSEFSKVHDIPVILISHVTKLPWNKRPDLNDFRDSSFIGQDADIAIMVWADMREKSKEEDRVEILLRKNRPRGMNVRFNVLWRDGGGRLLEDEPFHKKAGKEVSVDDKANMGISAPNVPQDWTKKY